MASEKLYRNTLKFFVCCNQEQCLILMLLFEKFGCLRAKIQGGRGGGLTSKGIVGNQTHFVLGVIGEITCVTPTWSYHGHSLN